MLDVELELKLPFSLQYLLTTQYSEEAFQHALYSVAERKIRQSLSLENCLKLFQKQLKFNQPLTLTPVIIQNIQLPQ